MPRRLRILTGIAVALLAVLSVHLEAADAGPGQSSGWVWEPAPGYRSAALTVPPQGRVGFTLLPSSTTGITFTNTLSNGTVSTNRLTEIGSGVALGDVDGDGRVDIYLCRIEGGNALYRNAGQWRFEDISAQSGVTLPGQASTGAVLVDLDGDGDLDLLVNSLGNGTQEFLNDGKGHFTPHPESGLDDKSGATSMALADVDGDGDLDLYVTHYRANTFQDRPPGLKMQTRILPDGRPAIEPRDRFVALAVPGGGATALERGEPDRLYINRGGGRFVAAPWNVGVFVDENGVAFEEAPTDWGLSVQFRDLNGDGLPDLYICNDFVYWPDRIWFNAGGKRFRAASTTAIRHVSLSAMSVDVADINRDGFFDIFAADMLSPHRADRAWQRPDTLAGTVTWPVEDPTFRPEATHNTLHLARGDGTFAEIARFAGVAATDWTWSSAFMDVDLDGWEDLLMTTGSHHELQDIDVNTGPEPPGTGRTARERERQWEKTARRALPSVALRNRRDLTFEDMSAGWGFNVVGVAHGMAFADLDNDGDLDVVVNAMDEAVRIFRNEASAPRIAVTLKGTRQNTRGASAKIRVTGGPVDQSQEMIVGGRYLSGDDPMRVFAAGTSRELAIEVTWRSGRKSRVEHAKPDRIYEIDEAGGEPGITNSAPAITALFEDWTPRLKHTHVDAAFDDFARNPLLPWKLSRLGPGVGIADIDGDGLDDLVVGGGVDGRPVVYRNGGGGKLGEWDGLPLPKSNPFDQMGIAGWRAADGRFRLLFGQSTWEAANTNGAPVTRHAVPPADPATAADAVEGILASAGPLALADIDGDGHLDLFVGGRLVAGRFPEAPRSYLLRGDAAGHFKLHSTFNPLGMVSGAVFSDIDGDGDPDLLLACSWGPIRVLRNEGGKFTEVTRELGLERFTGLWNGIAAGDFDGDGRTDFVASNWGLNWRTDQSPSMPASPVRLYHGDFAGTGGLTTLVASEDRQLGGVTPWRERSVVAGVIPSVPEKFPSFRAYSQAVMTKLLDTRTTPAGMLEAANFESMVFLNRGDRYEAKPLPAEAQFSAGFGISVADFNGDGIDDLFLAQNFFGMDRETTRLDAGTGVVFLGDGRGQFRALRPSESGVKIDGEQRGTAVGDFDQDGRPDLVVTQNAGETRLYRNQAAAPGLRILLRGPAGNPSAIGAQVRLRSGTATGAVHELHAGSGYLSQDSTTVITTAPKDGSVLEVRWPGGERQSFPVPAGTRTAEVRKDGLRAL